jgi:hypothetical protein
VALDDLADGHADLRGVGQRARLDARDRLEVGLGRGQQRLALAGALGGDERVAADDRALAGELLAGDLGEVVLVKQGGLNRAGARAALALRSIERGDPLEPVGPSPRRIASRLARVTVPRSATITSAPSPKRALSLSSWAGTVCRSWVAPSKDLDAHRPAGAVGQQPVVAGAGDVELGAHRAADQVRLIHAVAVPPPDRG